MQYPKYKTLTVSLDYAIYTFISIGLKGSFEIEVQFTPIIGSDYYNLGFGALDDARQINDTIVLNNGDRNKILATVSGFVEEFLKIYPNRQILFAGSTPARTRLYRRAITMNYSVLSVHFNIFGIIFNETPIVEEFESSKDYSAFLILKKQTYI